MTGFRDFLTRFRPVASPGRAAPGGVPADRSAELRAELLPPLTLLEQAEAEARSVRERADAAAAARRQEAEVLAAGIVAGAHEKARRARGRAAGLSLRAARSEAAELLAAADREAVAVRTRAGSRTPALTERALALVLHDITEQREPPPSREAGS
ncbi:hypothetical protein U5640_09070 [Streptomyces sp. SS7]|uniref:hypothetical protein n=1 Tax=Streptomyces sp. SS7 TaxID=3108485 RepID=UPI0030ED0DAF